MGFYCENCGREVKRNSDSCPSCGVNFKAVKCPSCGFTDKAEFFKSGCPSCGYLAEKEKMPLSDVQKSNKSRKPILSFIPASIFWISSLVLILFLIAILFGYLK